LKVQTEDTTALIDKILSVETDTANNYDVLAALYQKIFNLLLYKNQYIINEDKALLEMVESEPALQNGMEKEVVAALESVIPKAALNPFLMLNNTEKVTQLTELSNLVFGIRLFNKRIGKGGATLISTDELVERMDVEFLEKIRENLSIIIELSEEYNNYFLALIHNNGDANENKDLITDLLYLRQYTSILLSLMERVENSVDTVDQAKSRFDKELEELRKALGNKNTAPKEQVYPKFAVLSNNYLTILEESRMTTDKLALFAMMKENFDSYRFQMTEEQRNFAFEAAQEEEDPKELSEEVFNSNQVVYIEPKHTPEFLQTSLDILGFCIVTLVRTRGVLILGQHNIGVFKYRDESYVFKSEEEANMFVRNPQFYVDEFYKLCRQEPVLILLLKVEDYFKDRGISLIRVKKGERGASTKVMMDFSGEMFQFDPFMDPNHDLNEWALRRKAIQMANIRNMVTKAIQTPESLFKVENETQVWLKKEATTQTGINKGTNPIRPRNYITDLRDRTLQ